MKIAFLFAGQGSQAVGMGKDLYDNFDCVKRLYDMSEQSEAAKNICFNGSKEDLDITVNTQPALFLTDLACAVALREKLAEKGIAADGVAGFSLGEIPAACYAGLMSAENGFEFVQKRAEAMQLCAEKRKGAMFAVLKLSAEDVEGICAGVSHAYPVNYNSPSQTVVACAEESAEELQSAVKARGGKAVRLKVSGAFHSPFMDEASEAVRAFLESKRLGEIKIPLYTNLTAKPYDADSAKRLLAEQINNPVLWQKTVGNMTADGFGTFVEVGPGKTLSGLIAKINPDVRVYSVSDMESLNNTVRELGNA